jgi:excisionase family DNA binding protein
MTNAAASPPSGEQPPPLAEWPTPCAAALVLGISDRTVRRMIAKGKLAARDIGAGRVPRYVVNPNALAALANPANN